MLHRCIYFLARSETIRFRSLGLKMQLVAVRFLPFVRTLQCFVLNGVIFLGSILLFNFCVEPALSVLKRLIQDCWHNSDDDSL